MDATVIQCTICSSKMKLPSTHFGKKLKCPKCQAVLVTTAEGKLAKAVSAEQAQAAQAAKAGQAGQAGQAGLAKQPQQAASPTKKATAKTPQQQPQAAKAKSATAKTPQQQPQATKAKPAAAPEAKEAATKKEAAPAAKAGAGKGKLVMAKSAAPKKKAAGVRVNKEKLGNVKRRSVKDRVEALDHEKDTSRIIGVITAVVFIFAGLGTVAYFVFFPPEETELAEVFGEVELAVEPSLSEARTVDIRDHTGEIVTIQIYERNTDGMEFVKIPAGTYTIGGGEREEEQPEVEVTVPEFYIGHDEVTARQFREFVRHVRSLNQAIAQARLEVEAWERRAPRYAREMQAKIIQHDTTVYNHPFDESSSTPSNFGTDDEAVHNISWYDAFAYQMWANGLQPEFGTLPTEVDWEVAARGSRGTLYPWGNEVQELLDLSAGDTRVGDMRREERTAYIHENFGFVQEAGQPQIAGSDTMRDSPPPRNGFGVRNMFGNAAEYTWDRYSPKLYHYVRDINEPEYRAFGATGGEETLRTYNSLNPRRSLRASSIGIQRSQLTNSRFTRRVRISPRSPGNDLVVSDAVGFRAVFYPDGTAPYGDELEPLIELYNLRRQLPDYMAENEEGEPIWSMEEEREQREAFEEEIRERLATWNSPLD